ncbi:MAG TPA: DUF5667 domain-containing protein [Micromonosporaceae bacterium]
MSPPGLDRQRVKRFAQLLDDGDQSREHRSQLTDDEAGLAALGRRLAMIEVPGRVDSEFRTNLRAKLVAAAERVADERRSALTAPAPVAARARLSAGLAKGRTLLGSSPDAQRARTRKVIIAGVAVSALAVSGISTASEDSMPGDALYGMKRSTERAQLALAGTDLSRGELLLELARVRLGEAEAVRGDSAAFARLLDETDQETKNGVALLTGAAAESGQAAPLDTVASFVTRQRPALTRLLDVAPSDRERVTVSLALLDLVSARIEALRATLPCGTGADDDLGPQPASCGTGTGPPGAPPARRRGGQVTTSASNEPAPAVSAGPSGAAPTVTAMATGEPDANPSARGRSRTPEPRPSKSRS